MFYGLCGCNVSCDHCVAKTVYIVSLVLKGRICHFVITCLTLSARGPFF